MDGLQLEKLYVLIEAQTADFNNEMSKVNSRIDKMTSTVNKATTKGSKSFSTFGKAIVAAFSIRALIGFFNKFLEITKQTETFKKALADALNPLVVSIAPALNNILVAVATITAKLVGMYYAIRYGSDAMAQYKKDTQAATTAQEDLKSSYAGFDELQTISTPTSAATTTVPLIDTSAQIQEGINLWADYGDKVMKFLNTLKDIAIILAAIWAMMNIQAVATLLTPVVSAISMIIGAFWGEGIITAVGGQAIPGWLIYLQELAEGFMIWLSGLTQGSGLLGMTFGATAAVVSALIIAVAGAVYQLWNEVSDRANEFRNNVMDAFYGLVDTATLLYESTIKPFVDIMVSSLLMIWDEGIKPLWDGFVTAVAGISNVLMKLWTIFLKPIVDFLINIFGPTFVAIFGGAFAVISALFTIVLKMVGGLLAAFGQLMNWLSNVMEGGWSGLFKGLGNVFISFINLVIAGINGMIKSFLDPINFLIKGWNNSIGKVAGKIPEIQIGIKAIPYLAEGGMLNAGSLFVAGEAGAELIGSYSGQTTVMPLQNSDFTAAMKSAVIAGVVEGIAASSNGNSTTTLVVDGMTLAKAVETNLNKLSTIQGGLKIAM